MRPTLLLVSLTLAAAAPAQIPLPLFGSTFTSTLTRGFWFTSPTSFLITGLRVPNEAMQGFQVVEVIDLGTTPPPAYPGTVNGIQLFYDNTQASSAIIPCSILVQPGQVIGILGACNSSVGSATSYNSYATPAGAFTSSILGNPVTLTRMGTQSGIAANGGNQPLWQEAAAALARVEVYVAAPAGYAYTIPYGAGCNSATGTSFYENFPLGTFDLANSGMSLIHTGNGYLAVPGATGFVPPSGTATILALADDSEATVTLTSPLRVGSGSTTSSLTVCSNGFVSTGLGNGIGTTPAAATFLNAVRTGWWCWHNFNPAATGGGGVKFEQVGGIAYVTWDGVWDSGGTVASASRFQFQFDLATGNVHYAWQAMSSTGTGYLVGFSEGGPSVDPGNRDLSATLPSTFGVAFDVLPLALRSDARPVLGTSVNLQSTRIPAGSPLGVLVGGLTEYTTGISLGAIGMTGCNQYASNDASIVFVPTGFAGQVPFSVPNSAWLAGVRLVMQSAVVATGVNPLGIITSNGLRLHLDIN